MEVGENNNYSKIYATHQSKKQEDIYREATETSLDDFHSSTKAIIRSKNLNVKGYSELIDI